MANDLIVFGVAVALAEATRAAEVLLGPYTGDEHARRRVVVRDPRLNRAYDASVSLPERADPDAGKKKRARAPELEVGGPIPAPPLWAVPSRDGSAEASVRRLPEGATFRVDVSVSSSSSSNERAASRLEGAEAEDLGRTISQVHRAIGVIGLTGLAATESSGEVSPARSCEVEVEVVEDVPPMPPCGAGKLCYLLFAALLRGAN